MVEIWPFINILVGVCIIYKARCFCMYTLLQCVNIGVAKTEFLFSICRFAFVEFSESSAVNTALQYNGAIFGGRPLK